MRGKKNFLIWLSLSCLRIHSWMNRICKCWRENKKNEIPSPLASIVKIIAPEYTQIFNCNGNVYSISRNSLTMSFSSPNMQNIKEKKMEIKYRAFSRFCTLNPWYLFWLFIFKCMERIRKVSFTDSIPLLFLYPQQRIALWKIR